MNVDRVDAIIRTDPSSFLTDRLILDDDLDEDDDDDDDDDKDDDEDSEDDDEFDEDEDDDEPEPWQVCQVKAIPLNSKGT